jgi:hypothetical protein
MSTLLKIYNFVCWSCRGTMANLFFTGPKDKNGVWNDLYKGMGSGLTITNPLATPSWPKCPHLILSSVPCT